MARTINNQVLSGVTGKVGNIIVKHKGDMVTLSHYAGSNPSSSPMQQEVRETFFDNGMAWQAAGEDAYAAWDALGAQMQDRNGKPLSGWNAYVYVSAVLRSQGLAPTLVAPVTPVYPDAPPPLNLTAVFTAQYGLQISLDADSAYHSPVQIWGLRFLNAGRKLPKKRGFVQLGLLPSLATSNSLTDLYVNRFGAAPVGKRIAVQVIPVTPQGFARPPKTLACTVTHLSAANAAAPGDDLSLAG